jgi:hypothetical protein
MIETAFSGVVAALISTVAAVYARRGARHTKPLSNGFAQTVREDLKAVRGDVAEVRQLMTQHLRDHTR